MEHLDELTELVLKAKNDEDQINRIILMYKPFIASELSKIQNKFIDTNNDELMTTGMLAFAEAVKSYDQKKGAFIALARRIIRQRAIDQFRKEKSDLSFEALDTEQSEIDNRSIHLYHEQMEKERRIEVIHAYQEELSHWNIDFVELAKTSPKSSQLKDTYKAMSKYIYQNEPLLDEVRKNKRLPVQLLSEEYKVHRKKVERGRSFIIACLVLMDSKFKYLSDYIE